MTGGPFKADRHPRRPPPTRCSGSRPRASRTGPSGATPSRREVAPAHDRVRNRRGHPQAVYDDPYASPRPGENLPSRPAGRASFGDRAGRAADGTVTERHILLRDRKATGKGSRSRCPGHTGVRRDAPTEAGAHAAPLPASSTGASNAPPPRQQPARIRARTIDQRVGSAARSIAGYTVDRRRRTVRAAPRCCSPRPRSAAAR